MGIIKRIIWSLCISTALYLMFNALFLNGAQMINAGLFTVMGFMLLFFFVLAEWEFLRL